MLPREETLILRRISASDEGIMSPESDRRYSESRPWVRRRCARADCRSNDFTALLRSSELPLEIKTSKSSRVSLNAQLL